MAKRIKWIRRWDLAEDRRREVLRKPRAGGQFGRPVALGKSNNKPASPFDWTPNSPVPRLNEWEGEIQVEKR